MRDVNILLGRPSKGIRQANGIQVILLCVGSGFLADAGFIKRVKMVARHRIKFLSDTCTKPFKLEIIRLRMHAGIDILKQHRAIHYSEEYGL